MPHTVETLPAPSTYARILLQQHPQQQQLLLTDTGLEADSLFALDTITVAQQLTIFRNALALAGTADWGLKLGQRLSISSHGPLGFAAISAPTIGDGLDVFVNFARSRAPYIDLLAERCAEHYRLLLRYTLPLAVLELPMTEVLLLVIEAYVLTATGNAASQATLHFACPRPAHALLYRDYFKSPVYFDCSETCIQLPLSLCGTPCPLYDQHAYKTALARCREALKPIIDPSDAVSRVRNLLAAHFDRIGLDRAGNAAPRLQWVAATLCLSVRTLMRQLELQNTGFRRLLEEQQIATAHTLLDQARYSVADVGNLLGYSDAANFSRAFQRWSGMSPGRYRRRSNRKCPSDHTSVV